MAFQRTHIGANAILPPGTRVVTRIAGDVSKGRDNSPSGSVGTILRSPGDHLHSYRVRLVNGTEISLRRTEFELLSVVQEGGWELPPPFDLEKGVIIRCLIGSRAYGLEEPDSDVDRRGVYLPDADAQWSIYGVPEQLENDETQECYWELQKFLTLALKANPNVLECLYSPLVELTTELGDELLGMRSAFVTKLIYQTYNGYVLSQFKKIGQDLRNRGEIKWKHAMHLIRLLLSGIAALREGAIQVQVSTHRERLLAIRRKEVSWEEVERWRRSLHEEFDAALQNTRLPDRPDYKRVNSFLIKARRSRV